MTERTSSKTQLGVASYYNVKLPDGSQVADAAWYYPTPMVSGGERDGGALEEAAA